VASIAWRNLRGLHVVARAYESKCLVTGEDHVPGGHLPRVLVVYGHVHVHLHAPDGVHDVLEALEVDLHVVVYVQACQFLHSLYGQLRAPVGVCRVYLVVAIPTGYLHAAVAGYRDDSRLLVGRVVADQHHDVGAALHLAGHAAAVDPHHQGSHRLTLLLGVEGLGDPLDPHPGLLGFEPYIAPGEEDREQYHQCKRPPLEHRSPADPAPPGVMRLISVKVEVRFPGPLDVAPYLAALQAALAI
jgi:hypothetical protein